MYLHFWGDLCHSVAKLCFMFLLNVILSFCSECKTKVLFLLKTLEQFEMGFECVLMVTLYNMVVLVNKWIN